jgi:hypothetical protein
MTVATVAPGIDVRRLRAELGASTAAIGPLKTVDRLLVGESAASWHPVTTVTDRRPGHRIPCEVVGVLSPLDDRGRPTTAPKLDVRLTDVSEFGVGISHRHPMPHRLVHLVFPSSAGQLVRLLVRLKWCRFKRADCYQSGGQILRVVDWSGQASERLIRESLD